jgi:hypothetical protein
MFCTRCPNEARPGLKLCTPCADKAKAFHRADYLNRRAAGLCGRCGKRSEQMRGSKCVECADACASAARLKNPVLAPPPISRPSPIRGSFRGPLNSAL